MDSESNCKMENADQVITSNVNSELVEAKKYITEVETQEDTRKVQDKTTKTGSDRVNEALLMMTKPAVKPSYNIDYSKKYIQLQRTCQYQPYIKVRTAKDRNGKSLFWVAIGKSENVKFPLKANSESFLSLLNYIQNGTLDNEVDFNNNDFDDLEEEWEILYLEKLCQGDCNLKLYFGNKNNVYITHPAKFGELTFNLKEEGKVKLVIAEINK